MKIVYLHQYFAVPASSGGTRSYEMAKRIVRAGHSVQLITTSAFLPAGWEFKRGWNILDYDGIELHVLDMSYSNRMPFLSRFFRFFEFSLRSSLHVLSLSGDLIFATSTPLTIAIPAIIGKKWLSCPMIFEVRDVWPEIPRAMGIIKNPLLVGAAETLERYAYSNAVVVIALSEGMKKSIVESGQPDGKVKVIPNSCDFRLFRDMDHSKDLDCLLHPVMESTKLVVYLGTLGRVNGLQYLVALCKHLLVLDSDVKVAIFGDGMEREELESQAVAAGVHNRNLFFFKPVAKSEVPAILGRARLSLSLFLPIQEMWSNSANKFFDTLASGTAVAINYGGWQARYIQDYDAGIILDPFDIENSAKEIVRLVEDPVNSARIGRNAAFLGASCFDRDDLANTLISIIEEMVEVKDD